MQNVNKKKTIKEAFDLEGSFAHVMNLFEQFQQIVEQREYDLKRVIESKERDIESLTERNKVLFDSMKEITIVPDDHIFSIHINELRRTADELLGEAISFREYSEALLGKYQFKK